MNTPNIMKQIGERIRDRRNALGLTVEELAKKSQTTVDIIKQLEWSTIADIDLSTLQLIAAAMNQRVSELVPDELRMSN